MHRLNEAIATFLCQFAAQQAHFSRHYITNRFCTHFLQLIQNLVAGDNLVGMLHEIL